MSSALRGQVRAVADKELIRHRVNQYLENPTAWNKIKLRMGSYWLGFTAPLLPTKAGRAYYREMKKSNGGWTGATTD